MSDYKKARCPHCGASSNQGYRTDLSNKLRVTIQCPSCKKQYVVEHGQGEVESYPK